MSDFDRPRILAIGRDIGSVQAVAPVTRALIDRGFEVTAIAFETGLRVYEEYGVAPVSVAYRHFAADPNAFIQTLFDQHRPGLVLMGSSVPAASPPETPEQFSVLSAAARGIPTVGVLDAWSFYDERFGLTRSHETGRALLPDKLCVMDRTCCGDLIALGVAPERISITHNPWMDRIVSGRQEDIRPVSDRLMVVFASQPLKKNQRLRGWPYTQYDLFGIVAEALRRIGRQAKLFVWIHPSEDATLWHELVSQAGDVCAEIGVARGRDAYHGIDVLVTSHSTLVHEALHLDIPCIALRPGRPPLADNPADTLGLTLRAGSVDELARLFAGIDVDLRARMRERRFRLSDQGLFFSDGTATGRVANVIESFAACPPRMNA